MVCQPTRPTTPGVSADLTPGVNRQNKGFSPLRHPEGVPTTKDPVEIEQVAIPRGFFATPCTGWYRATLRMTGG